MRSRKQPAGMRRKQLRGKEDSYVAGQSIGTPIWQSEHSTTVLWFVEFIDWWPRIAGSPQNPPVESAISNIRATARYTTVCGVVSSISFDT